jgi:hypothetical protein
MDDTEPHIVHVPNGCGWMIVVAVVLLVIRYGCDMGGRW